MTETPVEQIELDLLLEALYQRHGRDFRAYARASLERRVLAFLPASGVPTVADLIPKVLRDAAFSDRLAEALSRASPREMFRNPAFFRALRDRIVPVLKTWPSVKVWLAGCSTGEELYAVAIVLAEEHLADRTTLYATDANDAALGKARDGIYGVERLQDFTLAYQAAGGTGSFSEYYRARYGSAIMIPELKANITFVNHNLATDGPLGEMHLVLCRNVLLDFNEALHNRVIGVFAESLARGGFLCLGTKENLLGSAAASKFETVDCDTRIYKRVGR